MKTTRREFIETAAGVAGSVALGAIGLKQAAGAAESGPVRLITYRGPRPTDPGRHSGCAIRSAAGPFQPALAAFVQVDQANAFTHLDPEPIRNTSRTTSATGWSCRTRGFRKR